MLMPNEDEILLFSRMIEGLAKNAHITLLEAIEHYCEESGLEEDVASTLVSRALKEKLREECVERNLLKKESSLPI